MASGPWGHELTSRLFGFSVLGPFSGQSLCDLIQVGMLVIQQQTYSTILLRELDLGLSDSGWKRLHY